MFRLPPAGGWQYRHPQISSWPDRSERGSAAAQKSAARRSNLHCPSDPKFSGRPSLPAHTLRKGSPATLDDYQSKVDCHFPRFGLPAAAQAHWSVIMIEPKQSDIGRKVIYLVHRNAEAEEGVITRFNEKYVFVRFGKEEESAVTTRDELEWKDARSQSS